MTYHLRLRVELLTLRSVPVVGIIINKRIRSSPLLFFLLFIMVDDDRGIIGFIFFIFCHSHNTTR